MLRLSSSASQAMRKELVETVMGIGPLFWRKKEQPEYTDIIMVINKINIFFEKSILVIKR